MPGLRGFHDPAIRGRRRSLGSPRGSLRTPTKLGVALTLQALEAGVPAKVVQEILGHASAMVTLDIYSHVVPTMKADAAQLVADQLGAKG